MDKTDSKVLICVVEDDDWYREYLVYTLSLDPEHQVSGFETAESFLNQNGTPPDIVTIDYSLPDSTGTELLPQIRKRFPEAEVIVISEQEKIDTALQLLKAGAYDYFVKSKDIRERLMNTVSHIKKGKAMQHRLRELEERTGDPAGYRKRIIGNSTAMQQVFDLIQKSLSNNLTVTIYGETGTGKEEVARAIHNYSVWSKGPFVAINMAAIPRELAESELFGHEKGSFTGAIASRAGKFEEANDGTIFLDEIGDLDASLQSKLLRVLQEKTVTRVGGNKSIKVNNRVIVATHKNLKAEVERGQFREDLYYRIFGLTIMLPPLRERGQDILLLAGHFITRFCHENKLQQKFLDEDARQKLLSYSFPGNVRELKSVIELSCVLSATNEIKSSDLHCDPQTDNSTFYGENMSLDDYIRKIIGYYLTRNGDNVQLTARQLGIGKSTIYRIMKNDLSDK